MGTEAAWVPAVIAAVGAATSAYTTKKAADNQDQIAAEGIRAQGARQLQADQRINEELKAMEGSNPDAERQKSLDDYMATLQEAKAQRAGDTNVAQAGSRYQADQKTSQAGIQNFGAKAADILSRIAATNNQRRNESIDIARMNSDVGGISRDAGADAFLTNLKYNAQRPNPWGLAAGQVAQGVAQGMASSGSYGSAPSMQANPATQNTIQPWKSQFGPNRGF